MDWFHLECGLLFLVAGYGVIFALAMWLDHLHYRATIRDRLNREVQHVSAVRSAGRLGSDMDVGREFNFADVGENEI